MITVEKWVPKVYCNERVSTRVTKPINQNFEVIYFVPRCSFATEVYTPIIITTLVPIELEKLQKKSLWQLCL